MCTAILGVRMHKGAIMMVSSIQTKSMHSAHVRKWVIIFMTPGQPVNPTKQPMPFDGQFSCVPISGHTSLLIPGVGKEAAKQTCSPPTLLAKARGPSCPCWAQNSQRGRPPCISIAVFA